MKKKLLSMLLAVAMVASLTVGCGGSEEPAAETTETSETTDETAEVPETSAPEWSDYDARIAAIRTPDRNRN